MKSMDVLYSLITFFFLIFPSISSSYNFASFSNSSFPRHSPQAFKSGKSIHNSSLTREITKILNTLLLNQDKNFRPYNDDPREPLVVEIDISVRSMGPISEQHMEFSLDCYFRQRWIDKRLAFTPVDPSRQEIPVASKMLKDIWTPDTYIRNGRKSYLHTLTVPNILFRVRSDGQVKVSQRLTIRSRCPMFLRKFPMDAQACPIEIGSLGYFTKDIRYVWKNVELDEKMGNMLSQYQLLDVYRTQMNISDYRFPDQQLSVLKVYFKLQRQQGFYILQIYTPCTLLVVMSWVSFWINKEASPARVALGIMTVLSMSTLGFGLRTDLPKVSHSTALDIYIISCFGFVFAAMVEYAVINYAHIFYIKKKMHELKGLESNKAIDSMRMFTASIMGARRETIQTEDLKLNLKPKKPWYRRLFRREKAETTSDSPSLSESIQSDPEVWLRIHSPSTLNIDTADLEKRGSVFYRMAVKAAKAREKLKLRDPAIVVNRIDNVSKIAFPSLYIIFNVLYWWAFLYWIPDEINDILKFDNRTSPYP
ncbi:lgc-37 [Pristionchus pacificus]|nr:lgc-37 [Pristionchus pacificus]